MIACVGFLQCDADQCEIEYGLELCSVVQCDEDHEYCLDDYFNGCGTIFLDAAGPMRFPYYHYLETLTSQQCRTTLSWTVPP